jgi:hypothetical protein
MADKTITNPAGAFGYTDLQTKLFSVTAPFQASADIAAKAVVSIGTDGTVATAATDAPSVAVGVAVDAISAGKTGLVVISGIAEDVPVNGAVAAGNVVKASVTTAGRVAATATPGVGEALAIAINASASNTVDLWVCKGA